MPRPFLLLDVDNTLYPRSTGLIDHVDRRIDRFLVERLAVAADEVDGVRRRLWREYGTTLFGLLHRGDIPHAEHDRFAEEYCRYVHDIDHAALLDASPALAAMLERIPMQKVAITNGSIAHATAVLERLGVRQVFFRVFALEHLGWVPKPYVHAYQRVLGALHARGRDCVLVDDVATNLPSARRLGMQVVHLADGSPPGDDVDAVIATIGELPVALDGLERAP
jgi:putative hydrolase of the HAD superfamily